MLGLPLSKSYSNFLFKIKIVTAYDVMKEWREANEITAHQFYELINDFQRKYLEIENYEEKLLQHRNTAQVKNGMLQKLYDGHRDLSNRPEMRDINTKEKIIGYVPSVVQEIWNADKRVKSLYNAIKLYCELRNKDFNTIAVHIAEYRAINKLISRIR